MRSWSLRLGRIFGIEVFVHWTFWILIVWVLLMHLRTGSLNEGLWGIAFVLAIFLCVVIHEFGHALTARRFGITTRDITLYPIGGIASLEGMPEKPEQELIVAIVGPFVNLAIASLLFVYLSVSGHVPDVAAIESATDITQLPFFYSLFLANIMLAAFNLVPAFPMDGGRAFRALLSLLGVGKVTATRVAAGLGQTLAILFVFLGFFFNFWLVFIGLFIFIGASGEVAYARLQSDLSGLTVNDALMYRFTILAPETTLGEAANVLLNGQETEFVILDNSKPVGLLTKNEIIRGLSEGGPQERISEFATDDFLVVDPKTSLSDFLQSTIQTGKQIAVVMDGEKLQGLIDRENLEEKLLIQDALNKRLG